MPIDIDLIGRTSDPVEFSWTHRDAMLYALAVGAGQDPATELALTTDNTADMTAAVLPAFLNIVSRVGQVPFDVDMTKLVHAEQSFELPAPLPTSGRASVSARLSEVWDKGAGALVTTEAVATDAESGRVLGTSRQTVFVRGAGGFGGDRGPSASWAPPDRGPDHEIGYRTRPEQALLYRLTGDRNPLHSDPAFAARAGFDRPILHGMCTYGFASRAVFEAVCDSDPARFAGMSARFTRPVYPGDDLRVSIWRDDTGADFVVASGDETVLDRGRVDTR